MDILTWTILKKTQVLNSCETFAFKYIYFWWQKIPNDFTINKIPQIVLNNLINSCKFKIIDNPIKI